MKKAEQNPVNRNLGKSTRKTAIDAMCAACMGCTADYMEPGFRTLIRECSSLHCPLHKFRPYK